MTVAFRAVGSWQSSLTADTAITIPAAQLTGDIVIVLAAWKDYAITAQITGTGWNEINEFADGSVSTGNGTGSMKVGAWYKVATSDTEANPTLDFSTTTGLLACATCIVFSQSLGAWATPLFVTAAWPITSVTQAITSSGSLTTVSSGAVINLIGLRNDSAAFTRTALGGIDSPTGMTWNGSYVEAPATHASTTTGNDMAADAGYRLISIGSSGQTLRSSATISAVETGAMLWVHINDTAGGGGNQLVTPTTAALVITPNIPTVTASDHQIVTPTTKTLTSALFAPAVSDNAYSAAVLADSPVGYWRMGEASGSVLDSIGSSHGTATGTTRDVTGVLSGAKDDGAITFNGTSDKVRMGDVLDQTGAVTYELWLKRANTTGALQYLMNKGAGQPNVVLKADHYITVGEENVDLVQSSTAILNNTDWHHIVFTWTGAAAVDAAKLYVDGVNVGVHQNTATIAGNSSSLSLGAAYVDALWFAGTIDEAAIYNSVLSPTRVLAHYNAARDNQIVTPTTAALVITKFAPTVTATDVQLVTPTTKVLALSTFAPIVTASDHQSVTPTTKVLALAAFAPSVTATDVQLVTPTTAAIVLSAFAPTISLTDHQLVTPTTKSAVLTTFAPTVTAPDHQLVTPSNAAVTLATFAPTVTSAQHQVATPTTATLTTASFAPAVSISDHQAVTPTTKALTLTTNAPVVTSPILATPTTAALVLTKNAPTVSTPETVTPTTKALTLSTFAPTITNPQTYVPDTAVLVTTKYAPIVDVTAASTIVVPNATLTITRNVAEVSATAHLAVTPQAATLTVTQFASSVTATAHEVVTPGVKSLIAATFAPTVSTSDQQGIVPGKATLTLATFAPTVSTTAHVAVIPSTKVLQLTAFAPTARVANYAIPTTAALTLSQFAPLVSATQNTYVEIVPNTLTITEYAPTLDITGHADIVPITAELHLALFPPTAEQHSITPLGEFVYGFAVVAMGDSAGVEGENGGATVRSEGGGTTVSTSGPSARVTVR